MIGAHSSLEFAACVLMQIDQGRPLKAYVVKHEVNLAGSSKSPGRVRKTMLKFCSER